MGVGYMDWCREPIRSSVSQSSSHLNFMALPLHLVCLRGRRNWGLIGDDCLNQVWKG